MKNKIIRILLSAMLCTAALVPASASVAAPVSSEVQNTDYHDIFDADYYAAVYPSVAACYTDDEALYRHYVSSGMRNGYQPSADFCPRYYRLNYPDLAEAFGDNWSMYAYHYVTTGADEGRVADSLLPGVVDDLGEESFSQVIDYEQEPVIKLSTTNEQEVQDAILASANLIGGRDLVYSHVPSLITRTPRKVYYDGSIFVICWQETINNHSCYFSEIIINDGSQFGRKLAGDTYGNTRLTTASALAQEAGAIVAANADYYKARSLGTVVYNGQICRFDSSLDTCYVNGNGDLIFSYGGEITSRTQLQEFIDTNDIRFGITFGPVLIDNGVARTINSYRLGQITGNYSRAALGQLGEHHYLIMEHNYWDGHGSGLLSDAISVMSQKGCDKAYTLDGGNTGEIVFDGAPYSRQAGKERDISDIIFFTSDRF